MRCMVECTPIKALQLFCRPMTPLIIVLPYDHLVSCPDPTLKEGKKGLVNLDRFLGLAGSVCARRHCSTEINLGSDWSWARLCAGRQFKFIQLAMALCIPAVGESYDYAKAAISLERSNSFPWIKDCIQIHQTLYPR